MRMKKAETSRYLVVDIKLISKTQTMHWHMTKYRIKTNILVIVFGNSKNNLNFKQRKALNDK